MEQRFRKDWRAEDKRSPPGIQVAPGAHVLGYPLVGKGVPPTPNGVYVKLTVQF